MPLGPEELKTIDFYNKNASGWSEQHSTPKFWGPEITRFKESLPSGKVIELGSGGGRDAMQLGETYSYFGTDISFELLHEANLNNPSLSFSQHSIYELGFPENTFDGFWASAILLHIPKEKIGNALGNIHRVCKNSAQGFIALKQGDGEEVLPDGRYFAYYQRREFAEILNDSNFKTLASYPVNKGGTTTWLVYFVEAIKTKSV